MQSEGGAAGAVHGALQAGALATTFTSSQGLLLMLPEHVQDRRRADAGRHPRRGARDRDPRALDLRRPLRRDGGPVDGLRPALLVVGAGGAGPRPRRARGDARGPGPVPPLLRRLPHLARAQHRRARSTRTTCGRCSTRRSSQPTAPGRCRPITRCSAAPPRTPTSSSRPARRRTRTTTRCPGIVQRHMDALAARTGRRYRLFDYTGAPDAERVIVMMGSGSTAAAEAVEALVAQGEKVGVLTVRLYRPFAADAFVAALPATAERVAVLDRCKEPGSLGEPLFQDVVTALAERGGTMPLVTGGRYGLASKEFTPAMAQAVFADLAEPEPRRRFTVGIVDDVSHLSLARRPVLHDRAGRRRPRGLLRPRRRRHRRREQELDRDHRRAHGRPRAGRTSSTTRRSRARSPSRTCASGRARSARRTSIDRADFVACHQFGLLEKIDVLEVAADGATFLLNAPYGPDDVWEHLPGRGPGADRRKAAPALRRRRHPGRPGGGDGPSRQHGAADLLLRPLGRAARSTRRSSRSRRRSAAPTASAARRCSTATRPPSTPRSTGSARSTVPADGHARPPPSLPAVGRARPTSSPAPRRRCSPAAATRSPSAPSRSTARSRSARPGSRSARSRRRSRSGIRRSASTAPSARSSARTPRSG